MSDKERERIQRIRDQQIKARDPGQKVNVQWKDESAKKQGSLVKEIFGVFPGKVKGAVVGLVIGIIFYFIIQLVLPVEWKALCGLLVILVCLILGMILGNTMDHRAWK